ncbi:MAG TPA: SRPBCC domain-containing protein, partial [Fimbriimonadaceae bacterium]|nr:SRPBCC domain-containing protein [Fimbriimonadaceae bacterium]
MNRTRTRTLAIARPAEEVFAALTETARLNDWFADGVEIAPKLGGRFAFDGIDGPSVGSISSFAPPHALAFSLGANGAKSTASFTLDAADVTKVTLTLAVEEENDEAVGLAADWVCLTLYNLRDYLETGRLCWEAGQSGSVTTSIQIHATPGDAFAALIEPERLRRWLSEKSHVDVGQGTYSFGWTENEEPAGPSNILSLEPDVRLLHDWYYPDDGHSQVE